MSNGVQIRGLWNIGDFNFVLFSNLVEFVNQFPIWGFCTWLNPFVLTHLNEVVNVEDIVVDERARGRGLGVVIVRALTIVAEMVGCYKVILDCSEENQGFY